MNTINKVHLTHHELLELIAVVRVIKSVAIQERNKPEAKLMSEYMRRLLDYDVDNKGTVVELDRMTRFGLWMCMEKYISFCVDQRLNDEYVTAVMIATKLSG